MSKAQELKPCPFCGSTNTPPRWSSPLYWIECADCGACSIQSLDEGKSVRCWNRRPASSEQQAAQQDADTIALPRKEWEELQYYLDRCYDKGHLDQCFDLVEPLEALNSAIAARASNGGKA